MDNQVVYVVTEYGCNSTPNDMLVPVSKIFVNYEAAYAYFLKMSPLLDDKDNEAKQFINSRYKNDVISNDSIMIEARVHVARAYCREGYYPAKRPIGVVISRNVIKNNN
jgi:hypothetical protein